MKRRLLIIAISLLIGGVVNVAVAWAIEIWSGPVPQRIENFSAVTQSDIESLWQHYAKPGWSSPPASVDGRAARLSMVGTCNLRLRSPQRTPLQSQERRFS